MELEIDPRFCGPPGAANGGYLAGRLAAFVKGVAEVTLRRATPLGRSLRVKPAADGVELLDGDAVLATARPTTLTLDPPRPVSIVEAHAAARAFPRFVDHPLPGCFVCGTERLAEDGLRIFPGPVPGSETIYAAPWTPDTTLADENGIVRDEHHWAALDCTGAFAVNEPPRGLALLAKLAAKIVRRVSLGEDLVVIGWPIAADGRKLHAGTAIHSADGELRAIAQALWILT